MKSISLILLPVSFSPLFGTTLLCCFFILASCHENKKPAIQGSLFKLQHPELTGVKFNNKIQESGLFNHIAWENVYHGAGVAIGDINNDGLPDIYFAGNQVSDRLYLNKGDFRFQDITKNLNLPVKHYWSSGVVMADINSDGLLDIYVNKSGPSLMENDRKNLLFVNQGDMTFKEEGISYGLAETGYSMQSAFFDYDGDGDLDVYIMNQPPSTQQEKMLDRIKPQSCRAFTDRLLRNDLNVKGSFTEVTDEAGVRNCAYGLGLTIVDVNQDGMDDIYVANDYFASDHLYINQGDGTFLDKADQYFNHQSLYAMGCDAGDFNKDGMIDFITADMSAISHYRNKANMPSMNTERFDDIINAGYAYQYMFNSLQLNQGNGQFSEVGQLAGVANTDWTWGILWIDADNDSDLDIVASNGIKKEVRNVDALNMLRGQLADGIIRLSEILAITPSEKLPNFAFENTGNLSFRKAKNWGLEKKSFSNGISYADLDNDGDLDIVINNVDEQAFVYKNKSINNYLKVKLVGESPNIFGIGSKIKLRYEGGELYKELRTVRGYLSAVEPVVTFGLGGIKKIKQLKITWPDGVNQVLNNIRANQTIIIEKDQSNHEKINQPIRNKGDGQMKPLFISKQNDYDDFEQEILLPYKLSELGPALAKGDINNDGLEDFYVGGASDQSGQLFVQNKRGNWIKQNGPWQLETDQEEVGALFLDIDNDGNQDLYIASGSNEFEIGDKALVDRLYIGDGKGGFKPGQALDFINTSTKAIAPFDIDGDGDLDLFVGGRLKQRSYPLPAKSYLLINEGGILINSTHKMPNDGEIGMVTGATWFDNSHGNLDLWVVGEWMPITTFRWMEGELREVDNGLQETVGLWQSIHCFDIDGDGDKDLIAGNFGLNSKFKANQDKILHLFANDFDGNGTLDIVLGNEQSNILYPVRGRECSSQQMPAIKKNFATYNEFASATLQEIYSIEKLESGFHSKLDELSSVCLINNDSTFKVLPLPRLAQISAVQAIVPVGNGKKGKSEYLVYGNLYETEVETTRLDGSYGVLLSWEEGKLSANPISSLGLSVRGNVKSAIRIKGLSERIIVGRSNAPLKILDLKG